MTRIRPALIALIALVASLAVTASAAAAPFTVGAGVRPRVAVDAAGTAYVGWTESATGDDVTHFCKVARGASACAAGSGRTFTPNPGPGDDNDSSGGPAVFVDGANVTVWMDRLDSSSGNSKSYAVTSGDGGSVFTAPAVVGANGTFASGDVVSLPSGAIATLDSIHTGGDRFQRQPLSGAAPTATDFATVGDNGAGTAFDGPSALASLGSAAEDRILAVMAQTGAPGNLGFRSFTGAPANANTLASWSAVSLLGAGNSPRLCTGAGGTTLVSVSGPGGSNVLERRQYDPASNTFGAASTITTSSQIDRFGCSRDGAGNLIVVFWIGTGSGQRLWSSARPGDVATLNGETPSMATSVAVAPDGGGWAAYESGGNVRLQPLSEAVFPGGGPGPGPGPTPGPGTGTTPGPIVTGPTTTVTGTPLIVNGIGISVGLKVPKACVPRPKRFYATATFKTIKKVRDKTLPNRGQFRALRVDFRVDGKLFFRDRKGPSFRALIGTIGRKSGVHTVTAKVTLRQRRLLKRNGRFRIVITKKLFYRTMKANFRVC